MLVYLIVDNGLYVRHVIIGGSYSSFHVEKSLMRLKGTEKVRTFQCPHISKAATCYVPT